MKGLTSCDSTPSASFFECLRDYHLGLYIGETQTKKVKSANSFELENINGQTEYIESV